MTRSHAAFVLSVGAALSFAGAARAGFGGQTILGPLTAGSSVTGDTTNSTDNNDGWFSGGPVFGIWDGNDDVWALDWVGGFLRIDLIYDNTFTDVDLFLYVPGNLDESSADSYGNTGIDTVTRHNAAAGTYYILVDSTAGAEGEYSLRIILPAPGAGAAMLLGLGAMARRRR
ncbi:MAG: PPC domain-containing protein [Phycisphaerales bacterium]|nr:PPC domain-containing protein [Phycisphaerales bacterium]